MLTRWKWQNRGGLTPWIMTTLPRFMGGSMLTVYCGTYSAITPNTTVYQGTKCLMVPNTNHRDDQSQRSGFDQFRSGITDGRSSTCPFRHWLRPPVANQWGEKCSLRARAPPTFWPKWVPWGTNRKASMPDQRLPRGRQRWLRHSGVRVYRTPARCLPSWRTSLLGPRVWTCLLYIWMWVLYKTSYQFRSNFEIEIYSI